MSKTRVLFVCLINRHRSKTAEALFKDHPMLEVRSAGLSQHSRVQLTSEMVDWADVVLVMENKQRKIVRRLFRDYCTSKQVKNLSVPDEYCFMDTDLQRLLGHKVRRALHIV